MRPGTENESAEIPGRKYYVLPAPSKCASLQDYLRGIPSSVADISNAIDTAPVYIPPLIIVLSFAIMLHRS